MSIPLKDIEKLATLSRLSFPAEALQKFSSDFENILQFVEKIKEAKTEGVPPLTSTAEIPSTPERPDAVTGTDRREAYQVIAPKTESGFYVVPKIVE